MIKGFAGSTDQAFRPIFATRINELDQRTQSHCVFPGAAADGLRTIRWQMDKSPPQQRDLALSARGHLSIRQDIVSVILSRGSLTNDEIKGIWDLDEESYAALKETLGEEKLIEPGPRGVGGFEAKIRRRAVAGTDSTAPDKSLFDTAWENATVERLVELISHDDAEHLLGDLLYTVRRMRLAMTNINRRGTKQELAAALVIQHGVDLFADAQVRDLIARKAKAKSPRRWVPGKAGALRFVANAGFPT